MPREWTHNDSWDERLPTRALASLGDPLRGIVEEASDVADCRFTATMKRPGGGVRAVTPTDFLAGLEGISDEELDAAGLRVVGSRLSLYLSVFEAVGGDVTLLRVEGSESAPVEGAFRRARELVDRGIREPDRAAEAAPARQDDPERAAEPAVPRRRGGLWHYPWLVAIGGLIIAAVVLYLLLGT